MDLFEHYEEDFLDLKQVIEQKIKNIPSLDTTQRPQEVRSVDADIQDAEQTLRSMTLSARNVPNNGKLLAKCKEYEIEISNWKSNLRKAETRLNSLRERDELFSGLRDGNISASMDQRERLLSNTERLEKSSKHLDEAISTAEETITIGIETVENLDRQKRQMLEIRENVGGINSQLSRAKGIIRSMGRRAIANKFIMIMIVVVLLFSITLIVYFKWFSGSGNASVSPPPPPPPPPPISTG